MMSDSDWEQPRYRIKINNVPSKFRRKEQKAKRVTFFRNGDYFDTGVRLALQGNKHFQSLSNLADYLSQKTKLTQGVRYFFTEDGSPVQRLEDFEDGKSYVVSSDKRFEALSYGAVSRVPTTHTIQTLPVREEDLRLIRPLTSTKKKKLLKNRSRSETRIPYGNRESRMVTVVNNDDRTKRSKILFNVHTAQNFEDILKDWGQSVKMNYASKMMTSLGREIRSVSQLKNELRDVETFYLGRHNMLNDHTFTTTALYRSRSSPNLNKDSYGSTMVKRQYDDIDNFPQKKPFLDWVHGYSGHVNGRNMYLARSGELLYPVGAFVVLYDRSLDRQRHYMKHTEDVLS